MKSAQTSDEVGPTIGLTSSVPIFKRLYIANYITLAPTFSYSWKNIKNRHHANFQADLGIIS